MSRFSTRQHSKVQQLIKKLPATFAIFDILFYQGRDLQGAGEDLFAQIEAMGMEGVVGKRKTKSDPSATDDKIGNKMINARAETLAEKPAFKRLISSKRCIIPTNGFYEWRKEGSTKQPMRILMKDDRLFSLAGLYDTWTDPEGNKLSTCTIITTEPNSLMEDIHNRMPVILRPEDESEWLGRDNDDVQSLLGLLKPYQASEMRAYELTLNQTNPLIQIHSLSNHLEIVPSLL
ncbi:hypothetical protein G195_008904 [Phytophthora kernoviae 00238/432]|uniref:Abasic site processing protein n=1 Tax=Phytophthora kernoviae 00238/432 TaxID=1284355 RepID=A0A8J4W2P4_9STRA|nr:hypothetical protein G195_008904 [Phytophthora kernoviae 00238/432]